MEMVTIVSPSISIPCKRRDTYPLLDYVRLRLHLCLERLCHQVLHHRLVSPHLWHVLVGLVVRIPDHGIPYHQSHRAPTLLQASELLLEPMVSGREGDCAGQ